MALLTGRPAPRSARLADVVVTVVDSENPAEAGACLLTAYPGLALAVVGASSGEVTVGVCSGPPVRLGRLTAPGQLTVGLLSTIAPLLHTWWVAGTLHDLRSTRCALLLAGSPVELFEPAEHTGKAG